MNKTIEQQKNLNLYIIYLQQRGHPESTINHYTRAIQHFYNWFRTTTLKYKISNEIINRFLYNHLPICNCTTPIPKNIKTLRAALNGLLFVVKANNSYNESDINNQSAIQNEIVEYSKYLIDICGLSQNTYIYRIRNVRNFLQKVFRNNTINIKRLQKINFHTYISENTKNCTIGTKNVIATSLRSYIKFLQFKGLIGEGFENVVPSVPNWQLDNLPKTFSEEQVEKFLKSFDCSTIVGIRDYSMALCMLDLALRASEVARIELKDINWNQSTLKIRATKSKRDRVLPLPSKLGKSIVKYLKNGRPATITKNIFVRHSVPKGIPLNTEQVRGAMRRAYACSGFSKTITGTHILRHTAATRMHQNGASIKDLADVLGHNSINTTQLYTKINFPQLKKVSMPWPSDGDYDE